MFLQHMMGVLYHPKKEWNAIRNEHYSTTHVFLAQISILAAIPAISLFIGTTQVGWSLTGSDYVTLSIASALPAAIAFYIAMWVAVGIIAYAVHWMEKTYGGSVGFDECMVLVTFTATPLFLSGLAGLYPMLWFNVIVGLLALSYSVYLLYAGVPQIMQIPEDRAFFFSTSILTVGLVVLVAILAATVILWGTFVPLSYNS
ncbi:putative membrane protein [Marinobacterium lacunae]|uniref:Putative membrane protein n=1 Tax=Marinobacterium lacunae TaxID=1232683 RepID=A0A081FWR7_9GAMM|nr:Yip1 family protein [Marinobacterium lacunae]KEA62972.1 putative membrane protein [Marinobacterium lacunae]